VPNSIDHAFEIERVEVGGWRDPPAPVTPSDFFPLIDPFGQYLHADWPEELQRVAEAEEQDLKDHPGPKNWDRYGGWSGGPQLAASGFFPVNLVRKYGSGWESAFADRHQQWHIEY